MSRRDRPRGTFQPTTLIAGALLLLILFVSAGYFFWLIPGGASDDVDPVDRHEARWTDSKPLAYRYVVRRSCDCPRDVLEPYVVTVSNGRTSFAFPIPVESMDGGFIDVPPAPESIADIFAAIRGAAADRADVSAGYDRQLGFPVAVTIRDGGNTRGWEIRDFEVLKAAGD